MSPVSLCKYTATAVLLSVISLTPVSASPAQIVPSKQPLPLEKILAKVRHQYGKLVVYNTRLLQQEKRTVRLIDFKSVTTSEDNEGMKRLIIDAYTGKEVKLATLKKPMTLENALANVRKKHDIEHITKTWIEQSDGLEVRVVEFIDSRNKRWNVRLDAYTGLLLDEHPFDFTVSGKRIPLSEILSVARKNHKNMVVLKTNSRQYENSPVREVVYLDDNGFRKRLVVHAITGEVISDKIDPGPLYR